MNCQIAYVNPLDVIMIHLSVPCGCKMSDYVLLFFKLLLKRIQHKRTQFYLFLAKMQQFNLAVSVHNMTFYNHRKH